MIKRFKEWITVKEKLHFSNSQPFYKEGEIWWCSTGENIGTEVNGKGSDFTRPVLIFKKFSSDTFFGLHLSSKEKSGSWFVQISFKGENQTIILNQGRTYCSTRLKSQMGQVGEYYFKKIKDGFYRLFLDMSPRERFSWEIPKLFLYFIKILFGVNLIK